MFAALSTLSPRSLNRAGLALAFSLLAGAAGTLSAQAPITLMPSSGQRGQTLQVTAQGLAYQPGLQLSFSPGGLMVSSIQPAGSANLAAANATGVRFTLTVTGAAQPGPYTLMASGQRGARMQPGAFTVIASPNAPPPAGTPGVNTYSTAAPKLPAQLIPNLGRPGETLQVTGQNINYFTGMQLLFTPPGLSASNIQPGAVGTAGSIRFTLAIAATANPGSYTLQIPAPNGPQITPGAFTVLPGPNIPPPTAEPPRVNLVTPQELTPGQTYTLKLTGTGFSTGMTVGFGSGVQNLGPAIFLGPQQAQLMVLVQPEATAGVRLAEARNARGAGNSGPGGVKIVPASLPPVKVKTYEQPPKPILPKIDLIHYVKGVIDQDEPQWGKKTHGEFTTDYGIPLINDDLVFKWHEENPGVAESYELRILDTDGKVLMTKKLGAGTNHYRPEPQFLADMLNAWKPGMGVPVMTALKKQGALLSAKDLAAKTGALVMTSGGVLGPAPAPAPASSAGGSMTLSPGLFSAATGFAMMINSAENADFFWEVAGLRSYPKSGGGSETVEAELSDRWPLRGPNDKPTGLGCSGSGSQKAALNLDPLSDKTVKDKNGRAALDSTGHEKIDPNNYPGDRFTLSGTLSLSNSPYATHPTSYTSTKPPPGGLFGDITDYQLDNVFIDWGDGTVEPLKLSPPKGTSSVDTFNSIKKLEMPKFRYQHVYAETGSYTVRVYQLAEADAQGINPAQLASTVDGSGKNLFLNLASLPAGMLGSSGPAASTSIGRSGIGGSPAAASSVSATVSLSGPVLAAIASPAPAAPSLKAVADRAYLLYCHKLVIMEREDLLASGPLNLDSVAITNFPGHDPAGGDASASGSGKSAKPGAAAAAVKPGASMKPSGASASAVKAPAPGKAPAASASLAPGALALGVASAEGSGPVTATTCDESFAAKAVLRYFGRGSAKVTWKLDGVAIHSETLSGLSSEPRHNLTEEQQWKGPAKISERTFYSCALNVQKLGDHVLLAEAEVLPEPSLGNLTGLLHAALLPAGASAVATRGAPSASASSALLGATLAPASSATRAPTVGVLNPATSSSGGPAVIYLGGALTGIAGAGAAMDGPPNHVISGRRTYRVLASDPTQPCAFEFPTNQGVFRVTDLQGKVTKSGDRYSGQGMLKFALTASPTSAQNYPVPVSFTNWAVPDGLTVTDGSLNVSSAVEINPPGVKGQLSQLQATVKGDMKATLSLKPKDTSLRLAAGETPPAWNGVAAPLTPDGDWIKGAIPLGETLIGWSAFRIKSAAISLDLSRTEGEPGAGACGGGGKSWVGVDLGNASLIPYTMDLVSGSALMPAVDNWVINDGGLCGSLKKDLGFDAPLGKGNVHIGMADIKAKNGTFSAKYDMKVHVPWLDADLAGTAELQSGGGEGAGISFPLSSPPVSHDYGPITMKVANLSFSQEENIGWRVKGDAHFDFRTESKPFTGVDVPGMRFGMDGHGYFEKGAASKNVPLGGTAMLGKTAMDLKSLQLTAAKTGDGLLNLDFATQVHLSEVMPAVDAQVGYKMTGPVPSVTGSGPVTPAFKVAVAYPAANPSTTADIKTSYDTASGENSRYDGELDLAMFGGPPVKGQFVLGYQGGHDFWLTRIEVGLGASGIPLAPPLPINLYKVRGGLGHNFPLTAFQMAGDLKSATPVIDGSYLFMAGLQVGSPDTFTFTLDGDLIIKATGPGAGARMDFHAWVLTKTHTGEGNFQGFFQYAGGNFDGELKGGMDFLGGAVKFTIPEHAMAMHFGGGYWFLRAGKKEGPRIKAKMLFAEANSYLSLGSDGLAMGGGQSIYIGGSVGHISGWYDVGLEITPEPHVSGHAAASVEAKLCGFGCCVGPTISADISASALPVHAHAHACVEIDLWLDTVSLCGNFDL